MKDSVDAWKFYDHVAIVLFQILNSTETKILSIKLGTKYQVLICGQSH